MSQEESQVSWKVWVVVSIVAASITPLAMELLPRVAAGISRLWHPSMECIASVSQPQSPLKIHKAPDRDSVGNVWAQQDVTAQVTVVGEQKGWYKISTPEQGWVEGERISAACLNQLQ